MGVIVRQSIITTIISYIGLVIGYLNLLYLYPLFLSPEQVGLMRTVQDAAILLAQFAQFGLAQSIIRYFPRFMGQVTQSTAASAEEAAAAAEELNAQSEELKRVVSELGALIGAGNAVPRTRPALVARLQRRLAPGTARASSGPDALFEPA